MTPRQVFNGIIIAIILHLLTFVGLWDWFPYIFMAWYIYKK